MFVKIKVGIGQFGKLWTSQIPQENCIVDAKLMNIKCLSSDASTIKLVLNSNVSDIETYLDMDETPTLYVGAGGSSTIGVNKNAQPVQTWNWSKRVGGYAILAPIKVLSGYVSSPPRVRDGYRWLNTYNGDLQSDCGQFRKEFVLVKTNEDGSIHQSHILEGFEIDRTSPLEREKKIRKDLADQADLYLKACDWLYQIDTPHHRKNQTHLILYKKVRENENEQDGYWLLNPVVNGNFTSEDVKTIQQITARIGQEPEENS